MRWLRLLFVGAQRTRSGCPAAPSPLCPQFLMIKVRREIYRTKKTGDILLLPPTNKFAQCMIDSFLLSAKPANLLSFRQQTIVDL